jgi:hypothetical protein
VRMKCDENGRAPITLVADKKDVKPKLLKRAISDAGYTVQEFIDVLRLELVGDGSRFREASDGQGFCWARLRCSFLRRFSTCSCQ